MNPCAQMNRSSALAMGEVLSYQDRLPLAWRRPGIDDPTHGELMDEALRVLQAWAMLEENHHRRGDDANPLEAEIERLHGKMNLVLEMLGCLLAAQQARPPPMPLALSAEGLLWLNAEDGLVAGTQVLVSIHLHRALARPLVLPAVIAHSGGGETSARFDALSPSCRSELERHVFLRHRRAVAESRSPHGR